ncbi:tyrosine--tRNA ligase [Alphaproteobacteria bacterium]|nr:tyrosine--tRNA ligase [Alphaproteobacteria bacterium]
MNKLNYIFKSELLRDLNSRGFLYQSTDCSFLDEVFSKDKKVTFYIGFDPTAKSLHLGHLAWIVLLNRLQKAGHKPIIIAGGATAKIGDPTWKDTERSLLEYETIAENTRRITSKLHKYINFDTGTNNAILLNNDDWISQINFMEFLRNFGRFFSVNKMLTMDSVSSRLEREQHLSFLEFSYSLLQAYDFLYLFKTYDCILEIGGADQWSNIISGVDLIRRATGKQTIGLTLPLLTTSFGKKMGKTENGSIWLDRDLTSPFDFWQYFRNIDDKDVITLLKFFTTLPLEKVEEMQNWQGTAKINDAKIIIADEITSFVHSQEDVEEIHSKIDAIFINKDFYSSSISEINVGKGEYLDKVMLDNNQVKSLSDARRLIKAGGIKINNERIEDIKYKLDSNCILSIGKKTVFKIIVEEQLSTKQCSVFS